MGQWPPLIGLVWFMNGNLLSILSNYDGRVTMQYWQLLMWCSKKNRHVVKELSGEKKTIWWPREYVIQTSRYVLCSICIGRMSIIWWFLCLVFVFTVGPRIVWIQIVWIHCSTFWSQNIQCVQVKIVLSKSWAYGQVALLKIYNIISLLDSFLAFWLKDISMYPA